MCRVKRVKAPVGPHTDCELSRDLLSHPHHLWPVCKEVPDPVTGGCWCASFASHLLNRSDCSESGIPEPMLCISVVTVQVLSKDHLLAC